MVGSENGGVIRPLCQEVETALHVPGQVEQGKAEDRLGTPFHFMEEEPKALRGVRVGDAFDPGEEPLEDGLFVFNTPFLQKFPVGVERVFLGGGNEFLAIDAEWRTEVNGHVLGREFAPEGSRRARSINVRRLRHPFILGHGHAGIRSQK